METTSTLPVVVESGGDQVVAHVGLHALGDFADRLGLGEHLSERIPIPSRTGPGARPGQGLGALLFDAGRWG